MQSPSKTFEDLEKLCDEAAAAFGEGRFKKARGLYLDALRTCDEIMDDGYRISIREYLGVSCYRLESFTEAEQHDRKTLQLLASRNDSDPKVITLRHNLARDLSAIHDRDLLKKLDKLEEAIVLHRQNLEVPQTSGKRRDQLLETKYSLAFDLAKLSKSSLDTEVARGLLEEAASLDEQVLQAREQKKPKDPLTVRLTIESRHNFASVLYRQKKYSKAKELFLQNLKDLDTLSSTERKDIGALLQSTDRHLAACCEATKDISLSIARITTESKKSYKQKRGAKEREELPSDLSNWKESGGAKKEPDGKLWQLSVESTNTNRKIKTTPAGLDTSLTHLSIEAPVNGGIVTTPAWSDIAASGNAQIQNGNVYANTIINNYNYATATPAAMNQSLGGQVAVPQPIFTVEAPLPEDNAIRRSRSQGHGSRSDSSLHPASALRPRSASSVPADDLSVEVPKTRSRSVSQPQKRTEKPSAKAKANRRRSTSSAGPSSDANIESSASISSSGESRNRQKEKTGSRRIQQNSLLKPEHLNRSRTRSSTGPVKKPTITNSSDKWFLDLSEHSHALLQYDSESDIPHRRRVRVAVIDSGLDRPITRTQQRADIRRHYKRFCRYKAFSSGTDAWTDSDPSRHGTNCASILLQVAPHAELYIANVVKKTTGNPSPSSVSAALEWALKKEVDIISMSLGFDKLHEDISRQIDLARLKGVLVFAAASNDGPNAPDWGVFPAWLSNVFCINSADVSGAKSWFNPKNTDEKLNFMFLGEEVGILGEDGTPLPGIARLTGTSFATPIAAGTAALVLDLVRMQNIEEEFPKIEPCLKTYEGMSSVFKKMSSPPTASGTEFYNVRPWRLLGKKGPPLSRANEPNESKQWYTLLKVVECLARFGDLDTGIASIP